MSCQLGYTSSETDQDVTHCLRLNAYEAQALIADLGLEQGYRNVVEMFSKVVSSVQPISGPTLSGSFVGTAMQASVAKMGAFHNKLITVGELRPILESNINDYKNKSGPAYEAGERQFGAEKFASKHWVIYLTCAIRLQIILTQFSDDARFYFNRTASAEATINVEWTAGFFLSTY